MATETELSGFTLEVYRDKRQELAFSALTVEQYQDPPPPRVSLRGITFEQHRFKKYRRRLFRKQWW